MNAQQLIDRNKKFAVQCVQLAEKLPDTKLGNHIRGQLIRCSTSVAANYRATRQAQSKAAFIAKLSIVIEEEVESEFWIDLGMEFKLFDSEFVLSLMKEARELTSIYIATRKSMRRK